MGLSDSLNEERVENSLNSSLVESGNIQNIQTKLGTNNPGPARNVLEEKRDELVHTTVHGTKPHEVRVLYADIVKRK